MIYDFLNIQHSASLHLRIKNIEEFKLIKVDLEICGGKPVKLKAYRGSI